MAGSRDGALWPVQGTAPFLSFVPEVPTKARACKHVYKHAVAPPSVSSRGHTVGTGNEFNSRGYLDIDVLSLCTNIQSPSGTKTVFRSAKINV